MDQIQEQLDPEIAQEVITLLNRKIAGLRSENAQLQVRHKPLVLSRDRSRNRTESSDSKPPKQDQLSRPPAKEEDESQGSSNGNTRNLLAEVQHWKSESERRLDPGEVRIVVVRCLPPQCAIGCRIRGEAQEKQAA